MFQGGESDRGESGSDLALPRKAKAHAGMLNTYNRVNARAGVHAMAVGRHGDVDTAAAVCTRRCGSCERG